MNNQPATKSPISAERAYATCEELTRRAARNFYYPISMLTRERRQAMCAAYAFSRGADDIADEEGITDRAARFADYRRRLAAAYDGAPEDETFTALADAVKRFPIRRADLEEIVEGAEQDLTVSRYRTYEDLRGYCHKVASAVGLVCVEIFGYTDPAARAHAETLGIAMQLTNILRDVGEDARRGRIYLPLEELEKFGVKEQEVLDGAFSDRFRELMKFQVKRARETFAKSEGLFPLLGRKPRFCPLALRSLYVKVLRKVERADYDVFRKRHSLSPLSKTLCVMGAWFRAWTY